MTTAGAATHFRSFPVKDGSLVIGGVPLPRLAERVGQTPFFAYDRNRLTERVSELRSHLPQGITSLLRD